MDEPNNQEDEYVEEEIEVYEEVEVDEEEEKNDNTSERRQSPNKIDIIKNSTKPEENNELNFNNINIEEKKEENLNENKLPLLSEQIKSEIKESNINNFDEGVNNINFSNNNDNNAYKLDMINNFNFDNNEENKILNLDYKILPEKDNIELQNNFKKLDDYVQNELNLNQNQIKNEINNNNILNNEENKNNIAPQQSNNFRSKIKRNNKKFNKNNNINNNIQKNQENNYLNYQNSNSKEIKNEINHKSTTPEIQNKPPLNLINNQNDNGINKFNEQNEIINENNNDNNNNFNNNDDIYNIINNNKSYNFENNNNDYNNNLANIKENIIYKGDDINNKKEEKIVETEYKNENNIINDEESNNEKNKAANKKSIEEEKYESTIVELIGNKEIIELFESRKWEEKKQGFLKLNQFLKENKENEFIKNNFENIFMFISMKLNNFKETNFNLLKEGISSFNILFSCLKENNNPNNKIFLETIITNINEKICDSKIKENYIQLLNTLIDLYSPKAVYELLFEILLKTNKINVLKEYSLFIKEHIKKENSINDFDIKNLIEFSVKIANNTNPQLRSIAIEIIGLLYTFIGPDLKQLISGIKESTMKLVEKEIDKIKYNKNNENKIEDNKIKDLIMKKNKNNSEKNNENNLNNNKRIDISKELTPKLLREINRGKWIEKKEGIEFINSVIDKANNKISKNGLQELFELIKDKLNDGNQNFVKMILQLLNHLIISLESQIKYFHSNLIYPLLLKLSDKNKLIRDECITCIENWIKNQNFDIFAIHIPNLLITNENLELRIELLNLLTKNKDHIKNTYPKTFFKELTKSFLTCLQDKNVKIRSSTEELIITFSNFIPREKYILELKDIKSTISDYLYNIIDKLLPKLNEENLIEEKTTTEEKEKDSTIRQSLVVYDTNNDKDVILVNKNLFSPKKNTKNKNKRNKNSNVALSLDKKSYIKTKDETFKKREKNDLKQNNQMNSTVILNTKKNKVVKNIKSNLMGYEKISSPFNKKNEDSKLNTINIKAEEQSNRNNNKLKIMNNKIKTHQDMKKSKHKERNSSMILENKSSILNRKESDNSSQKDLKSLTAEKMIKIKKVSNNISNPKNESFIKRPTKKVNTKKFMNNNGNDNSSKNKLFLPSYKIKKGLKEKRYEKDKKNNFYSELQNFDYLPKIQEYFKNVFNNDFINKFFSNDLRGINSSISQLKLYMDESLNSNNEENFNKLIDNLDLILKVIASKIYNNQTASLIKTFFIFADTLINIYKIKKYIFNDTEINILLNTFVDKLTNTNLILKETACNLIWFLNDQIEPSKTFITLIQLLEFKNAKLKTEVIDIIIKLFENSNFDTYVVTKVLKNLIREYFEADFNNKKKFLYLLQNIYNMIGNEFWKYTIFLSSKERDELENNLEIEDNDINYEQKDLNKEYVIGDFSGSDFGEDVLIDNNNTMNKNNNNLGDINQDDIKLHIKYFQEEDENINTKKINPNKNHVFKRSITDNLNPQQKKEETPVQNIDKNNYMTNIPTQKKITEKTTDDASSKCISEKELFEALDMLTNPDEDLVEAIINIHYITYRNYLQNKKVLNQYSDKIISSFTEIITKLFSFEPLRIKIIKYYILVLCKLCNIKEFISNILINTQKNLIILVLTNLLRENLNTLGDNEEGTTILKSLNSIITHVIEFCNITKNIEIIIGLEKKFRKEKPKLAEYSARCLIIVTQHVKDMWIGLNYNVIFSKINEILDDFLKEDRELQPKEKTDQTILITLRNLINEITKAKKENILDDYNKWIKEANVTNEKYILNWIKESLNRININKNLNKDKDNSNSNEINDDNDHIIIGNKRKSLNDIKKKWKELQEKQDDS